MQTFFEDLYERFQDLHQEIEAAIEGLPQAALDWPPGPEMNSIAVLVVHLTGAERYWVGDVVAGDPSNRQREAEFLAKGLTGQELKYRLADTLTYIRNQLAGLSVQDLAELRLTPRDDQEFTVGWALLHALEHTALHLGQIQLNRQWWHYRQIA